MCRARHWTRRACRTHARGGAWTSPITRVLTARLWRAACRPLRRCPGPVRLLTSIGSPWAATPPNWKAWRRSRACLTTHTALRWIATHCWRCWPPPCRKPSQHPRARTRRPAWPIRLQSARNPSYRLSATNAPFEAEGPARSHGATVVGNADQRARWATPPERRRRRYMQSLIGGASRSITWPARCGAGREDGCIDEVLQPRRPERPINSS